MKNNLKKVVISASSSQHLVIKKWLKYWKEKGYRVINHPIQIKKSNFQTDWPKIHKDFFSSLSKADILFIANEDKKGFTGYVGVGVFAELSFVLGLNFIRKRKIKIVLYKKPSRQSVFYEDTVLWLKLRWINLFNKKQWDK